MSINSEFMNLSVAQNHMGHEVRGTIQPPKSSGSMAKLLQWTLTSASVCPVSVFEWFETPKCETPNASGQAILAAKKADPARENDCILCRACEIQCPVTAIKITEP